MSNWYIRRWDCANPKAVILLVHGLGEFVDRYDWAASQFTARGFAVIAADLPGHGKTPGRRGHIRRFQDLFTAIEAEVEVANDNYPHQPLVFLGHSMGGLAVVRYFQTQTVPENTVAVILSSPCLQFAFPVKPSQERMMRTFSRIWPTLLQPTNIRPEDVTRNPEIQAVYRTHPLILHKVSVRLLNEFYDAMALSRVDETPCAVPVFLAQAGQDKLASPAANQHFFETLAAPDKHFQLYPQCHHELLNEPERADVLNDMVRWLEATIASPAEES